ncbi:MAG TPA: class I SAM-dependent methyltransferase [Acidimicrobiales bacterium]
MTEVDPPGGNAASGWDRFQTTYWNSIAMRYDTLYGSEWSRREDEVVRRRLTAVVPQDLMGVVLDLGCGRGLAYELLQRNGSVACYVGTDLSSEMLARSSAPKGQVVQQAMDKIAVADRSVAAVIASFSSASYAEGLDALLAETARVLRPGGVGYLSFLSVRALSRLRQLFGSSLYRTRGDERRWAVAPAHRVRRRQLVAMAERARLVVHAVNGVNALSGLAEVPALWGVGRALACVVPSSSHTLELTVRVP